MSYITFKSNGRGPDVNLHVTAERDETLALVFSVEDQESGDEIADYYIDSPGEIELFFAAMWELEKDYKNQL